MSAKKASTAQPRNRERAAETLQRSARSRAEACPKPHAARVGRLEHPGRRPSKPKLCWGHGRISLVTQARHLHLYSFFAGPYVMLKFCKNLAGLSPAPTYLPTYLPYLWETKKEITRRVKVGYHTN